MYLLQYVNAGIHIECVLNERYSADVYFEFIFPARSYLLLSILIFSPSRVRSADSSWEPRSTPG